MHEGGAFMKRYVLSARANFCISLGQFGDFDGDFFFNFNDKIQKHAFKMSNHEHLKCEIKWRLNRR